MVAGMALEGEMSIVLFWIAVVCYGLMFVFMFVYFYELTKNLSIAEKAWEAGLVTSFVAGVALIFWEAMR